MSHLLKVLYTNVRRKQEEKPRVMHRILDSLHCLSSLYIYALNTCVAVNITRLYNMTLIVTMKIIRSLS